MFMVFNVGKYTILHGSYGGCLMPGETGTSDPNKNYPTHGGLFDGDEYHGIIRKKNSNKKHTNYKIEYSNSLFSPFERGLFRRT